MGGSSGNSHTLWLLVGFGQAAGQVGDQRREESELTVLPLGSLMLGWVTTGWTCPWLKTTALEQRPSPDSSLRRNHHCSSFSILNVTVVLGMMMFQSLGLCPTPLYTVPWSTALNASLREPCVLQDAD